MAKAASALGIPAPVDLLTPPFGIVSLSSCGLLIGLCSRLNAFLILFQLATFIYFLRSDPGALELALVYSLGPTMILTARNGNWALDGTLSKIPRGTTLTAATHSSRNCSFRKPGSIMVFIIFIFKPDF